MIDKAIIEKNFSKYARDYDRYSRVQEFSASRLIKESFGGRFRKILDIGCGTGNYTRLLKDMFPQAKIKAVDISAEMIKVAEGKLRDEKVEFVVADAENLCLEEKFDLISSNASLQWFQYLRSDLAYYKQALNPDGMISFSTFGPRTFFQLHDCLEELFGRPVLISADNFLDREEVGRILKDIFSHPTIEEENYDQDYGSLIELLEGLKRTGTRGYGLSEKMFWTPRRIASMEEIYRKKFPGSGDKGITVTYQVFFCRGINSG